MDAHTNQLHPDEAHPDKAAASGEGGCDSFQCLHNYLEPFFMSNYDEKV